MVSKMTPNLFAVSRTAVVSASAVRTAAIDEMYGAY